MFKDYCLLADFPTDLPAPILSLLQEFEDVFPDETPKGLPPLCGIEIRLTLFQVLLSQTDQLTELTPKKLRSFNAKLLS